MKTDVSPNVRIIPGSDAISLELNIKGMTEPNRDLVEVQGEDGDKTQASSNRNTLEQRGATLTITSKSNTFAEAMQKQMGATGGSKSPGLPVLSRNKTIDITGADHNTAVA